MVTNGKRTLTLADTIAARRKPAGRRSTARQRLVIITLGNTPAQALLDTGLYDRFDPEFRTLVMINSDIESLKAVNLSQEKGVVHTVEVEVPEWAQAPAYTDFEDFIKFLHPDRGYGGQMSGLATRHEGYISVAAHAELNAILMSALQAAGRREVDEQHVSVSVLVLAFAGRNTGSGGLLPLLAMLRNASVKLRNEMDTHVLVGAQIPSVRVVDYEEYLASTITLLCELTAARISGLDVAPGLSLPKNESLWFQAFLFGVPPNRSGTEIDVAESTKFMAAVMGTRLDEVIGVEIDGQLAPRGNRMHLVDERTGLPCMFSAMGLAELRYESQVATELASSLLYNEMLKEIRERGLR